MLPISSTSVTEGGAGKEAEQLDRWLLQIAQNDTQALAELYQHTYSAVYAFALSILKNTHDAEDVLHDCYLNIFLAASSYRSAGKPLAWIMTITRNLCLHKFREHSRTADVPYEELERWFAVPESVSAEDKLVLWECMNRLSVEEREIVVLHAVNGFKHREIAAILKLPLATVLSKYNRALKKLRNSL